MLFPIYPAFQRLVVPYAVGEDPDDGYSVIPYEKGASFLLYLERTVGGLEAWIRESPLRRREKS